MTRKKLLDDVKQDPSRIYRTPSDVLRDRRFNDDDRLEILQAWRERDADGENHGIGVVIQEVEHRLTAAH